VNRRTVLVVGDYRQTLTIVRSLTGAGYRVIAGVDRSKTTHVSQSRRVAELWPHPPMQSDGFAGSLTDAIEHFAPTVILPVGDKEISWFSQRAGDIGIPIASVSHAVASLCQEKPALLAAADMLGIPHSTSSVASDLSALGDAADDVGYPCIIKSNDPLRRVFGSKGTVCADRSEFERRLSRWPEGHESLIVQKFLDGARHNLYFAAHEGEVLGIVEVEILRTDRLDGTGYAVDGRTVDLRPDLAEQTRALAKDLDYTGVGCTQFIVSPSGETSFLELNPRLGANYVVADAAGLPLARIAVDLARGRTVDAVHDTRSGLRYAWTIGDLYGLRHSITHSGLSPGDTLRWMVRILTTALRARVHVTLASTDPLPSLSLFWRDLLQPLYHEVKRWALRVTHLSRR